MTVGSIRQCAVVHTSGGGGGGGGAGAGGGPH
jgi:hypothetical protein